MSLPLVDFFLRSSYTRHRFRRSRLTRDEAVNARRWMMVAAVILVAPALVHGQENSFQQGLQALSKRDYDLAITCFSAEIRRNAKSGPAFANRGNAYAGKGDYDKAIADFSQAIRLNPADSHAYNNRGYAYDARGEYDRAIADYNHAIQLNTKDSDAYFNRGNAYRSKGSFDQAVSDYSESIRLQPKLASAYNSRGTIYHEMKDYKRAIADFSTAIRLQPGFGRAFENRGLSWEKAGECDKAQADFLEAIKLNPQSANAYNNLAWLWATCGKARLRDGKKAVEYGTQACELSHWHDPFCLGTLAAAYAEAGKFPEAIQWQSRALDFADVYGSFATEQARQRLLLYEARKPYHEAD
jgi:tetratricopeptide (TPR) repeat protein